MAAARRDLEQILLEALEKTPPQWEKPRKYVIIDRDPRCSHGCDDMIIKARSDLEAVIAFINFYVEEFIRNTTTKQEIIKHLAARVRYEDRGTDIISLVVKGAFWKDHVSTYEPYLMRVGERVWPSHQTQTKRAAADG